MTRNGAPIDKLDPKVGEVHVIALQQPYGKPVQSRFGGDQLMFTLVDGRKMFLDPYVQERMKAANVAPGVPFEIERVETIQGNRRTVEVVVRPVRGAGAVASTPTLADRGYTVTPQPTPAPPPVVGRVEFAPPPMPVLPVNGAGETLSDLYLQAFTSAVDIALRGVEIAKAKGLLISPAFEDVRTIATCIHLGRSGR